MSMSFFQSLLIVILLLRSCPVTLAQIPRGTQQTSASVAITPAEVTLHVGETQTFEAIVKGTQSTGIRWAIQERNGGRVTADGTYTAPRHIGLYHVIAASEEDPTAKAVAKVTVVTEFDPYDYQKLR